MASSLLGKLYLGLLYPMMDYLAAVYPLAARRKSRVMREELEALLAGRLGDRQMSKVVRDGFSLYLKRQMENLFFGRLTQESLADLVEVEGIANLEAAVAKGKGVILLLSHFGSFLMPLPLLGFMGFKVNQITGRVLSRGALSRALWSIRKREADRLPIQFIGVGNFLRPVYDALKRGEIVAVAFDGREGKKWVSASFLTRTALFSPGPFNLAAKTGAAIVPMFAVRQPDNRHRIIFMEEFALSRAADPDEALAEDTRRYAAMLASFVERHPAHFGATLVDIRLNAENGLMSPLWEN